MNIKTYRYPKKLLLLALLMSIFPTLSLLMFSTRFGLGAYLARNILIYILCLPIVIMSAAPVVWSIYTYLVKISICEDGLKVENPFKTSLFKWSDIEYLDRISVFSVTFPTFGKPRDLKITFKDDTKVIVHYFIVSGNGNKDGIGELEQDILLKLMEC